jgi:Domain of unknown function (DUF4330)/IPT/TIG domain
MRLVDDHGRLFGRWNVVDALIGVVLLALIPLLYGGYVLFRPQAASLVSIEPARIQAASDVDVTIHGNNLRPYMRVSFDGLQGRNFLFADPSTAVVRAAGLPAGVYDVILYDNAQERARISKGLEVVAAPRPTTEVDLIGSFVALTEPMAAQVKVDLQIAGLGRVTRAATAQPSMTRTAVGPREFLNLPSRSASNVPAVIRATCEVVARGGAASCSALETNLMRDVTLTVPLSGGNALFQIDQVRSAGATTTVDVRARLAGERLVIERVRKGDVDVERRNPFATGGEVLSVGPVTRASSSVVVSIAPQAPDASPSIMAGDIASVDVLLRVASQQTAEGWTYRGQPLTAGRSFVFNGPGYDLTGTILSVASK